MRELDVKTGKMIPRSCNSNDEVKRYVGERYFWIWDFMVFDFKLKNAELFIYAIIFGIYRGTSGYFKGSRDYLALWTGSSKRTVAAALASLVEKEYIFKYTESTPVGKKNVYYVNVTKLPICRVFKSENTAKEIIEKEIKAGKCANASEIFEPDINPYTNTYPSRYLKNIGIDC